MRAARVSTVFALLAAFPALTSTSGCASSNGRGAGDGGKGGDGDGGGDGDDAGTGGDGDGGDVHTCVDADGDGFGTGTERSRCAQSALDADDNDPHACADLDEDGCDDCRSGHFDQTNDCCFGLPISVDATMWIDLACEPSVTTMNEQLIEVEDRATGKIFAVSGDWAWSASASATGLSAAVTSGGHLIGPALPAADLFAPSDLAYFYVQRVSTLSISALRPSTAFLWNDGTQIVRAHLPWEDGNLYWDAPDSGRISGPAPAAIYGAWAVYTLTRQGATATIRVNGTEVASRADVMTTIDGAATAEVQPWAAHTLHGTLGEALLVRGALSAADLQAIEQHLMAKWGVSTGLDVAAPVGDDLVRACVSLGSCEGTGPTACLRGQVTRLRTDEIRCLAAAGSDCAAAAACIGEQATAVTDCMESCDGGRRITCSGGTQISTPCATALESTGPSCAVGGSGPVCAGSGTCSPGDTACQGTFALVCGAVLYGVDCGRYGWTCTTEGGAAHCTDGAAPPCDAGTYPRCDGGSLVVCLDGFELRQPCDRTVNGLGCHLATADDDHAYCGLDDACDPRVDDGTCDGDKLTFCAAGVRRAVDCGDLGFTGCQPATSGASRCTL